MWKRKNPNPVVNQAIGTGVRPLVELATLAAIDHIADARVHRNLGFVPEELSERIVEHCNPTQLEAAERSAATAGRRMRTEKHWKRHCSEQFGEMEKRADRTWRQTFHDLEKEEEGKKKAFKERQKELLEKSEREKKVVVALTETESLRVSQRTKKTKSRASMSPPKATPAGKGQNASKSSLLKQVIKGMHVKGTPGIW